MRGRTAAMRWTAVVAGTAALVAAPIVAGAWPVADSDESATALVARVRAAADASYTGLVTSRGGVELPDDRSLTSVAKLLGRDGTIRVWWQDPRTWRVATMRTTGETDLTHRGRFTLRWVYESKNLTLYPDVPVRLPTSVDVLPPLLAVRVLQGVRPEEVSRLPARRVAGRTALGLRLRPTGEQSSVGRVEIWADEESGLPLAVEMFGRSGPSALATEFTEVDLGRPDRSALAWQVPRDARRRYDETVDLASGADRYADRTVPETLAGLPRRIDGLRSAGAFGRGPTLLLAIPVRARDARSLRRELRSRPGAVCLPEGDVVTTGPVTMMLTRRRYSDDWVLAGTVTQDTLVRATKELRVELDVALPEFLHAEAACP